jgi:preprotein translocase subunit SecB
MLGLLNFEEYFVEEIYVKAKPKFEKKGRNEGEIAISFDIKRKDMELRFMIPMEIKLNHSKKDSFNAPYQVILKITGFFSFPKGTDEETIHKMIGLNGLSILYGVARGVIAQATANCPHGKFILPSVNFIELMKSKMKRPRTKKKKS